MRVVWSQNINKRLREVGLFDKIGAPQKFLIKLPDGQENIFTDSNYAAICEKINVSQTKGNVFDLIRPDILNLFLENIVLPFGLCDLHIDYGNELLGARNIVFDDNGKIIIVDTDPHGITLRNRQICNTYQGATTCENFDPYHFFSDKKILPFELFVSMWLLNTSAHNPVNYKLGLDLGYWVHTFNMGVVESYRYYNFDNASGHNPPQNDSYAVFPNVHFDLAFFEQHRKVLQRAAFHCMQKIIECRQEIEKLYPDLHQRVCSYFNIPEPDTRVVDNSGNEFKIVPVEDYFFYTTTTYGIAGIKFSDLEREFGQPQATEK